MADEVKVKRDGKGRFLPGTPGISPGRPRRQTEIDYMRVVLDACPLDVWKQVVEVAVKCAKQGDAQARAWLSRYLVGKVEAVAPRPLDVIVSQLVGRDNVREAVKEALTLDDVEDVLFGRWQKRVDEKAVEAAMLLLDDES